MQFDFLKQSMQRVQTNTPEQINEEVRRQMRGRLCYYATANPAEINQRLEKLNKEWDIERALQAGAAGLTLLGLIRGIFGRRLWLLLPLVATGFLAQYALQGRCPPVTLLRRFHVRTAEEIEEERFALKAMRGDFRGLSESIPLPEAGAIDRILEAVER